MRSLLFVPADDERKLRKALDCGADALILDLEDSVALDRKDHAREIARDFLAGVTRDAPRPRLLVRVNSLDTGLVDGDLDVVMPAGPDGIMLPKARNGADVQHLGAKLAVREAENALADGGTAIFAIATETAGALFGLASYTGASRRLAGLAWGAEDLSSALGAETNRRADGGYAGPYELARTLTLIGARAAGVDPIDTVFTAFRDDDGLRRECEAARRDGFACKLAIHPAQIGIINEVFTPTAEALARAQAILDAFARQPAAGVISLNGEMLDRPHLTRAQRVIARAPRS